MEFTKSSTLTLAPTYPPPPPRPGVLMRMCGGVVLGLEIEINLPSSGTSAWKLGKGNATAASFADSRAAWGLFPQEMQSCLRKS